MDGGEVTTTKPIVLNTTDLNDTNGDLTPSKIRLPFFAPMDLLGKTFIREASDGQKFRAKVVRQIQELDDSNREWIKFLIELGDGDVDEILDYNVLSDLIERQQSQDDEDESEKLWTIRKITGHQGPFAPHDKR
jgi:hypothetical protein